MESPILTVPFGRGRPREVEQIAIRFEALHERAHAGVLGMVENCQVRLGGATGKVCRVDVEIGVVYIDDVKRTRRRRAAVQGA
jgi:hypothetical protein